MKLDDPVVVVCDDAQLYAARVVSVGSDRLYVKVAYAVRPDEDRSPWVGSTISFPLVEEGQTWCRGRSGPAVDALQAAASL